MHQIEVIEEQASKFSKIFYSLKVNGIHIWRFDAKSSADIVAENLERALCQKD